MRIISGIHKGRNIVAPAGLPVRPTTDFAKEGLFNILFNNFNLDGIKVLDLFAGTGNISFEFASRGASEVTSVDRNHNCIGFIKKTALMLHLPICPVKSDVLPFLNHCHDQYNIVFADPPYDLNIHEKVVTAVFTQNILLPEGWLIVEHSENTDLSKHEHFFEKRKYGKVNFSFFK